jgi:Tfp pilus assembly protein PilF
MMVIGGGGYVFPRYLKTLWPDSLVEVVEIDPGVTKAAMAAFGLDRNTKIKTIHMDARNYVDQLLGQERAGEGERRYDFIYEDAINDYSVPFQLVTKEFNDKIAHLLGDGGVYVVNLIDTYESGRFLGAVLCTLDETFPHVYVVTSQRGLPSLRDTFVVIAAKRRLDVRDILDGYNKHLAFWLLDESEMRHLKDKCRGIVLTDDYAPVENMLAPVVCQGAREILAYKYLTGARTLQEEGRRDLRRAQELPSGGQRDVSAATRRQGTEKYERSAELYERTVRLNPSMSIKAYNEIGMMRVEEGRLDEAARAFRSAIEYHQTAGTQEAAIASVHMNLGVLLRRMDEPGEGRRQLAEAIKWFRIDLEENPRSIVAWDRLGNVLAMREDMKGASEAFEKAVSLEPENLSHYDNLAKTLEFQGRYGEAIDVVRKQMKLLQEQGRRDLASQRRQYIELLEYRRAKQRL